MTPEERKGIEELLAGGYTGNPATITWLKRQLDADDWDKSIEKMGGGRKARNAYMKPVFDTRCAVTGFDTHAQLMTDGRERGMWIWLHDESKARAEIYDLWAADAFKLFCQFAGIDEKSSETFRLSTAMQEFKRVANAKVDEAALLEWPAVTKMYAVIGREIKKHEEQHGPIKARNSREPDRRQGKRRQDDKTKARLKR